MSIVVALEKPFEGQPQLYLIEPRDAADQGSRPMSLNKKLVQALNQRVRQLNSPETPDPDTLVKEIGRDLLALLSTHPVIGHTVQDRFDVTSPREEPIYLYFEHRMDDLESWPWEALYAENVGVLSRHPQFAVARSQFCAAKKTAWTFEPPLRILAILGASGSVGDHEEQISGVAQWEGLRDAVQRSGLPVELRILTCDPDLMHDINAQSLDWANADLIPPSRPARAGHTPPDPASGVGARDLLFGYIKAYAPHILHFFSHATANPLPELRVGTHSDFLKHAPGSIFIDGKQLKDRADSSGNIWLVTLACCETARRGADRTSLSIPVAAALARQGVPAVVGMREQIPDHFANAFTHLFYEALLNDLGTRIARVPAIGGEVDIHWACALYTIRQHQDEHGGNVLAWTWPVMHSSYEFKLVMKAPLAPPVRVAPRKRKRLSASKIAELQDELLQLHDDRRIIVDSKQALKIVDRRIAAIDKQLRQVQGGSHA